MIDIFGYSLMVVTGNKLCLHLNIMCAMGVHFLIASWDCELRQEYIHSSYHENSINSSSNERKR